MYLIPVLVSAAPSGAFAPRVGGCHLLQHSALHLLGKQTFTAGRERGAVSGCRRVGQSKEKDDNFISVEQVGFPLPEEDRWKLNQMRMDCEDNGERQREEETEQMGEKWDVFQKERKAVGNDQGDLLKQKKTTPMNVFVFIAIIQPNRQNRCLRFIYFRKPQIC